ncbi:class I SAM-dependent methyltransferase [Haloferula sp. BvORR071]|uniref:class I SAM-dependent methyltransferase n=1 Tax=Haloferula sp. BvORR071 TaxID=1396141 RepID=UPI0006986DD3|nr:class I SAM-dependent methyltransferase [Haloferula sp. BvORR071]
MKTHSPSDTAILIGRSILLSARDASLAPLLSAGEEEATRRILGERASEGWFGFAEQQPWFRSCLMAAKHLLLGGIFAHYLARKRWIEGEVFRALEAGVRQVVIAGAGYDTLAWRLHRDWPEVQFFEVDHPATQAPKREALGESENLHFLPGDLSALTLPEILVPDARYRRDESTLLIAEGLTMYLPEPRVRALLASAAMLAGTKGRVIFTFMEAGEDGSISFRGENPLVSLWLQLRREPFRWGCSRDELSSFLRSTGLRAESVANHRELRARILAPRRAPFVRLARGECLCLCEPLVR